MWLWRNPEIKRYGYRYGILSLLAVFCAGLCFGLAAAAYVSVFCLAGGILFWQATKKRYEALSALSARLDVLLHSQTPLQFTPDEEGELALLSSEIQKLTLRLSEQAWQLERDKEYMKDSLADISHQIRTPLTSIRLLLSRLQRTANGDQEYIREIRCLLTRMEWQVSVLLKIARLESGTVHMEENVLSMEEVVQKAWAPLVIQAELKGLAAQFCVPEEILFYGDGGWTVEAVGNLLKNCAEHLPFGGRLWITASQNPLYTELLVADDGPGIPPEDLPHVFERFYRGAGSYMSGNNGKADTGEPRPEGDRDVYGQEEHAGIGLALARQIIREQGGTLTVKNRPEGGVEFTIRFYRSGHHGTERV